MPTKLFTVFRKRTPAGVLTFLLVDDGRSCHIVDDQGKNYGAWQDVGLFRSRLAANEPGLALGTARVEILATS